MSVLLYRDVHFALYHFRFRMIECIKTALFQGTNKILHESTMKFGLTPIYVSMSNRFHRKEAKQNLLKIKLTRLA